MMPSLTTPRPRPLSPNVQIYRPQLTSVLSILHRVTGIVLSVCAVVLVIWLVVAAWGPQTYASVLGAIASWVGRTSATGPPTALHLCGAVSALVWDMAWRIPDFGGWSTCYTGWSVVCCERGASLR